MTERKGNPMDENRKCVNIYTDGACSGNPGPGGWGAILEFGPHKKELHGYMAGTTNNRMELFAAISALGALKQRFQSGKPGSVVYPDRTDKKTPCGIHQGERSCGSSGK